MAIVYAIQDAISQGVLWGMLTLGVYVTFKILDIPDMTCDGSFALGGCVTAALLVAGVHPVPAILASVVAGMLAGFVTGILHTKLMIPAILSGILSMIALYSVNLRIIGGASQALLGIDTVFTQLMELTGLSQSNMRLIVGIIFAVIMIMLLYWFFGTEIGSAIRATGNNPYMVRALGCNTNTTIMISLVLSNGLIALSGSLVAQSQGYSDVKMGQGAIVIGLASIVIGEVFLSKKANFAYVLTTVILGSIVYRIIIAVVLQMGLSTDDLKLLTAVVVAAALGIPNVKQKLAVKRTPA
ncbi:MAG: ABC transporter permease [Anaerostipes sp.]|uniref:ABC transporter permease n=1 Tax=Anaerostipes sp. 992a TaxID=1261637 RepID=UPI0009526640|nr:ABC transporter permease [Anaerostipes sp. 992a]MCI5951668.1 ABC transporter permease [Anaerostipes sp.]MDD5969157.1 ABC transporter permease [Anaerostipes sp.]OLR62234.1 ABC transporter permease [Anaerostipes sp. 992a]